MAGDFVLAELEMSHAVQHVALARDALKDDNLLRAVQNLNDARTDLFYARKRVKSLLASGIPPTPA